MKYLVVYDTSYGNTSMIAAAVAKGLGGDAIAIEVENLDPEHFVGLTLLVVGSPTQGGRPTASLQEWLDALSGPIARAAVFDTRLGGGWFARVALDLVGYAAPRIASTLRRKGYTLIDEPQGYMVSSSEGPLVPGELERATAWGTALRAKVMTHAATAVT